jgi:hypothetical protein
MITASTLNNPTVQARIYAAMRWATICATQTEYPVETGRYNLCQHSPGHGVVYVENNKGNNWLRVDYRKGDKRPFVFYAATDGDITATVLQSLRSN